jgi:hypothetical protein
MRKRQPLSLKTKLAAALLQMVRPDDSGSLIPIIPYEDAKKMTADQIISLFQFHHNILHAHDGPDEPWNLEPKPIMEHRRETATRDVPMAAKSKRIQAREAGHKKPRTITRWRRFNGEIVEAPRER